MPNKNYDWKYDFNNEIALEVLEKWKYLLFIKYVLYYRKHNPSSNINDAIAIYANDTPFAYDSYIEQYEIYYRYYITHHNHNLKEKK